MKTSFPVTIFLLLISSSLFSQTLVIKETLFLQPHSSIVNEYFKDGYRVVLKQANGRAEVIQLNQKGDSVSLLDSFIMRNMGFVFFVENSDLYYYRILENKNDNKVYLIKRNLIKNTADTIFLKTNNNIGILKAKIILFNDTAAVQLAYIDTVINRASNIYYLLKNTNICYTLEQKNYLQFGQTYADFFLKGNDFMITTNYDINKINMYVYHLSNGTADSSSSYFHPFKYSDNRFGFNYINVNNKMFMVNIYTFNLSNMDSLALIDIGSGTSLNIVKTFVLGHQATFIMNSLNASYILGGNDSIGAKCNIISPTLNLTNKENMSHSLAKNNILYYESFFENGDTIYICGTSDLNNRYATIEKIYPAATGIEKQSKVLPTFKAYPNPAREMLTLEYLNNTFSQICIFDINGKALQTECPDNNKINVSNLASGLYFIKALAADGNILSTKFYKE